MASEWRGGRTRFTMRDSGSILDGKYEILGPLGRGGMGEVYQARHLHLHELRVIKILRRDLATEPGLIDRFLREARIATQIKHANVAILHDTHKLQDGSYYMVWEFVEGVDLAKRMAKSGPIEVGLAVELAIQALRGLEAIHTAGVVHRDVSPDNLMVRADAKGRPQLKIIDLGLARSVHMPAASDLEKTDAGVVLGKLRYCSPEQAGGFGGVIDPRSDLYSLAAVLYEMVSGMPPYESESQQGFVLKRLTEDALPLAARNPAVPVPSMLDEILRRGLARDPADRFPDAVSFIRALVKLADHLRGVSTVEMEVPARPKPTLQEAPATGLGGPWPQAGARGARPGTNPGTGAGTSAGMRELSARDREELLAEIERAVGRRAARVEASRQDQELTDRAREAEALFERYVVERRHGLAAMALQTLLDLAPKHPRRALLAERLAALGQSVDLEAQAQAAAAAARAALLHQDVEAARRQVEEVRRLEGAGASGSRSLELSAELSRAEIQTRQAGEEQQRRARLERAIAAREFDAAEAELAALQRLGTPKVALDGYREAVLGARRAAEHGEIEASHERDAAARVAAEDWAAARDVARRLHELLPQSEMPARLATEVARREEAARRSASIDEGVSQVEAYIAAGNAADAELALKILVRIDPQNPHRKRLARQIEALARV